MNPKRPYIPIPIRLEVAVRQLRENVVIGEYDYWVQNQTRKNLVTPKDGRRLAFALKLLFGKKKFDLDHDPALARRIFNEATGKYSPDANDPNFLIYRERSEDHARKTFGKGRSTTLGSDIHEIAKTKRLERQAAGLPKRKRRGRPFASDSRPKLRGPKRKWASRPFPKHSKIGPS